MERIDEDLQGVREDADQPQMEGVVLEDEGNGPDEIDNVEEGYGGAEEEVDNVEADADENGLVLPELVIIKIVEKVGDFNELLKMRLVSRFVRKCAEKVLEKRTSLWKREFQDYAAFVRSCNGTRITSEDEARRFLDDMEYHRANPFPNHTLIFSSSIHRHPVGHILTQEESNAILGFYNQFLLIVAKFGSFIKSLVYCFQETQHVNYQILCGEIGCLANIPNLTNLAVFRQEITVTPEIYDLNGHRFRFEASRHILPAFELPSLRELLIFGNSEYENQIGVPALIRSICTTAAPTVEKMQFQFSDSYFVSQDEIYADQGDIIFPKLKKLKLVGGIIRRQDALIFTNASIPADLEDLAISIHLSNDRARLEVFIMNEIFLGMRDMFLTQLKRFHLDIVGPNIRRARELNVDGISALCFATVQTLEISYLAISKWPNILKFFAKIFPNQRNLAINIDEQSNGFPSAEEGRRYFLSLFTECGELLETIWARCYLWGIRRDGETVTWNSKY